MTTATGNIIFTIGSKMGPGGFASLQSAIQLVGALATKVRETMKEMEQFTTVYQNLSIDQ